MPLVGVKFAFPFRLAMPESAFLLRREAKSYSVRSKSGYATRTFEYGAPAHSDSEWEWLRAVFATGEEGTPNREIAFTNDPDHYLAKVTDYVGFTFIDVMFEVPAPNPKDDESRLKGIADEAFQVARQFVDVYRELTNEPDVFHPSMEDSPGLEIFVAEEYEMSEDGVEGQFARISRTIRWNLEYVSGATKATLANDRLAVLGDRLSSGYELPLHMQLLLDAKDYSILHGHHRLAVVAVGSAFEVFLQRRLLVECQIRELDHLPVSRRDNATRPVVEALEGASLKAHLLDLHCRHLCGRSVKDHEAYRAWDARAYGPRNEVIHQGRREVTEAEVRAAFEATVTYMNHLDAELASSRPTD